VTHVIQLDLMILVPAAFALLCVALRHSSPSSPRWIALAAIVVQIGLFLSLVPDGVMRGARLTGAVRKARKSADTVVVYLHFGVERAGCPSSMQTSIVSSLIGAGADIVVGSHAHQLQGAGRSGKALVDYGLGNFVWYSRMSVASITTGVLKVSVTGRRINSYSLVPATISGGSPVPLGGAKRAKAIAAWKALRGCTGLQS